MGIRFAKHDSALSRALRHLQLEGLGLGLITVSTLVAVVGFAFSARACARPAAQELTITVRVYNYAQTPSTMLAEAEREASRILGEAGLKSAWLDCPIVPSTDIPQNPCPEPIEAAEVRLRILSVPVRNSLHDTAYGFAIAPALASVYSEAALRFARNDEGEFEAPIVLGCAIAHEIGHLLLGSNSHSISGVMCAHWERKHIRQALMGAMLFSPAEAKLIQAEMRRRTTS
jgi:hypothetical protein